MERKYLLLTVALFLGLGITVDCRGKGQINFEKYYDSYGCDPVGPCDFYFKGITIKDGDGNNLYYKSSTGVTDDSSTVYFSISPTVDLPSDMMVYISMSVYDEDWFYDDHIRTMSGKLVDFRNAEVDQWNLKTLSSGNGMLTISYKLVSCDSHFTGRGCDDCVQNYYGSQCNRYCRPVSGSYTCNYVGQKICVGMKTGSNCQYSVVSWSTVYKSTGDNNLIDVDFNNYDLEVIADGSDGSHFDIHFKVGSGWIAFQWDLSSSSSVLTLDMHNSGFGSKCENDGRLTNIPVPNTRTRFWKFSKDSSYLYMYCDGYEVARIHRSSFDCLTYYTQWQSLGTGSYPIFFYSDDVASKYYRLSRKCTTTNGGWSSWSGWGSCDCDHNTGTGTWTRTRTCTNPTPACGGASCSGASSDTGNCDSQCCETVNGGWTNWGRWSMCDCDYNTGTGTWNRTRSCTNPPPSCYGTDCVGELLQNGTCDDQCFRHCPELTTNDLVGEGFYHYKLSFPKDVYKRIWLTDTGSDSPTKYGSEVDIVCEDCYYLCGLDKRTCLPDRTWGEEIPLCQIRSCHRPESDETKSNAIYKPTKSVYDCGDTVIFQCKDDCYEYDEGTETHTCQPDLPDNYDPWQSKAKWYGNPYSCKIKQCRALEAPENGQISSTETTCGTTVNFSCDEWHKLLGKKELKCQSDKTWSADVPTCVRE